MMTRRSTDVGGFALVLTLALVSLLLLIVYALTLLVKVSGQVSVATTYRIVAEQHARLGLAQAIGSLQALAGPDDRVTGMAGIAGVPGGSQIRHWCGVWTGGGEFLGWLTSGADSTVVPSLGSGSVVSLVAQKTVGVRPASLSAYVDEEYVDAARVAVRGPTVMGPETLIGAYAYWVGDEGVKISAVVPDGELPVAGHRIEIASTPTNIARMRDAYQGYDTENAARILSYEQATNLFYGTGTKLTAASLRDSFHHVTVTHRSSSSPGGAVAGLVNLNTTSAVVWRSLIEGYELSPGATPFGTASKRTSAINTLANGISGSSSGKAADAPYTSVAAFLGSSLLAEAVTGTDGITVEDFVTAMAPMLATRSDTFRIRAYGEAVNPADPLKIESVAYCEAIVQRTAAAAPNAQGRRFAVTYFRWLGPDDI